jgi:GntR family transcriptional regulator
MQYDEDRPPFRLQLNPSLGVPLYRQIIDGIKELIAVGTLRSGDQLPSIRELSALLRINPSSAVKAYSELKHDEVIVLDQGRGTFVRAGSNAAAQSRDDLLHQAIDAVITRGHTLGFSDPELAAAFNTRIRLNRRSTRRPA